MGRLAADYDLAPAETVLESVVLLGGSECDAASWLGMGLGTPEWKSFRDGESPLTPAMAVALHRHLGAPVGFWLDLERQWRWVQMESVVVPPLCFETAEERDEPMSPLEMPPPVGWWDRLRKWLGVL